MKPVTFTVQSDLAHELYIIIQERIQTLQSEKKSATDNVIVGIINRQLDRAYQLQSKVSSKLGA